MCYRKVIKIFSDYKIWPYEVKFVGINFRGSKMGGVGCGIADSTYRALSYRKFKNGIYNKLPTQTWTHYIHCHGDLLARKNTLPLATDECE